MNTQIIDPSFALLLSFQTERHSPLLCLRSRPSLDSGKMRASVRMTRYLESWGAAKPFANLHHRDSMTTDNGKINTTVSVTRGEHTPAPPGRFLNDLLPSQGCAHGSVPLPEERKVSLDAAAAADSASLRADPRASVPRCLFASGPNRKGGGLRRNSMSG